MPSLGLHSTISKMFSKRNIINHILFSITYNTFSLHARQYSVKYVHNYHKEIEVALNKQILYEHHAALDYLNMAINFLHPSISYMGVGKYFMKMYKEELQHMEDLIHYQLTRGGLPVVYPEKQTNQCCNSLTLVGAFTRALEMENTITKHLQNIVSIAEARKDYQCADFITSKFLEEQVQSIHKLSQQVIILNRLCDSEQALWLYDKDLQ